MGTYTTQQAERFINRINNVNLFEILGLSKRITDVVSPGTIKQVLKGPNGFENFPVLFRQDLANIFPEGNLDKPIQCLIREVKALDREGPNFRIQSWLIEKVLEEENTEEELVPAEEPADSVPEEIESEPPVTILETFGMKPRKAWAYLLARGQNTGGPFGEILVRINNLFYDQSNPYIYLETIGVDRKALNEMLESFAAKEVLSSRPGPNGDSTELRLYPERMAWRAAPGEKRVEISEEEETYVPVEPAADQEKSNTVEPINETVPPESKRKSTDHGDAEIQRDVSLIDLSEEEVDRIQEIFRHPDFSLNNRAPRNAEILDKISDLGKIVHLFRTASSLPGFPKITFSYITKNLIKMGYSRGDSIKKTLRYLNKAGIIDRIDDTVWQLTQEFIDAVLRENLAKIKTEAVEEETVTENTAPIEEIPEEVTPETATKVEDEVPPKSKEKKPNKKNKKEKSKRIAPKDFSRKNLKVFREMVQRRNIPLPARILSQIKIPPRIIIELLVKASGLRTYPYMRRGLIVNILNADQQKTEETISKYISYLRNFGILDNDRVGRYARWWISPDFINNVVGENKPPDIPEKVTNPKPPIIGFTKEAILGKVSSAELEAFRQIVCKPGFFILFERERPIRISQDHANLVLHKICQSESYPFVSRGDLVDILNSVNPLTEKGNKNRLTYLKKLGILESDVGKISHWWISFDLIRRVLKEHQPAESPEKPPIEIPVVAENEVGERFRRNLAKKKIHWLLKIPDTSQRFTSEQNIIGFLAAVSKFPNFPILTREFMEKTLAEMGLANGLYQKKGLNNHINYLCRIGAIERPSPEHVNPQWRVPARLIRKVMDESGRIREAMEVSLNTLKKSMEKLDREIASAKNYLEGLIAERDETLNGINLLEECLLTDE